MPDIFISYKREDVTIVKSLAGKLSKMGWSVWWDNDIPAGKDYDSIIETELKNARCVIVLWTKSSIQSVNVKAEAREAFNRKILIPIVLGEVAPPILFSMIQSIKWNSNNIIKEKDFTELTRHIKDMIGIPKFKASEKSYGYPKDSNESSENRTTNNKKSNSINSIWAKFKIPILLFFLLILLIPVYYYISKTNYKSAISGNDTDSLFNKANSYLVNQKYDSAIITYNLFEKNFPNSEKMKIVNDNKVDIIYNRFLQNPEAVIKSFSELANKFPNSQIEKKSLFTIAYIYDRFDTKENSIKAYKDFLIKYPTDIETDDNMSESAKTMLGILESGLTPDEYILKRIANQTK